MPRHASDSLRSERIELRAAPAEKALLLRAAALERLDVTTFILRAALPRAEQVIASAQRIELTERDSLKVLELLENPSPPSPRLAAAAKDRLERE